MEIVAVPSIDKIAFIVGVVAKVLVPEPDKIRLLYVVTLPVCATPV